MKLLSEILGIELPIIQAPMAGAQRSAMTIAVSNAGGLGSLPCAMLSHEEIRRELAAIREGMDRPYNVNFFCHRQPRVDEAREQAWRKILGKYYRELGLDPDEAAPVASRGSFDETAAGILTEFKPPVVSFHFGLPHPDLVERVRSWGAKILSSATTVEEAVWLQSHGVDFIIAQGAEAGGHRGMFLTQDLTTQMGTFALLPQIISAVDVPVIAAGGIANAAGVAAAIALGAAGVQIGTAYLLCPEATTSPLHRAALKSHRARHTALTNVFTGRPAREIVNRIVSEIGPMNPAAPEFPLATPAILPLRGKAESSGSDDFSPLWSGQNASGCREIPASELTRELAGMVQPTAQTES